MCFSASASYASAAVLIPVGLYTVRTTIQTDRRYLGLAIFPLCFGIQQAVEGGLWQAMGRSDPEQTHMFALAFLFFAYLLWPLLVPLSARLVETDPARRKMFFGLSVLGCALGLSLFVPLLFHADWVSVRIVGHSIDYNSTLIWDSLAQNPYLRGVYVGVVCIPLLASSVRSVRIFGLLITISVIIGFLFAQYAFTSIWCYMAAMLSFYILFVIRQITPERARNVIA